MSQGKQLDTFSPDLEFVFAYLPAEHFTLMKDTHVVQLILGRIMDWGRGRSCQCLELMAYESSRRKCKSNMQSSKHVYGNEECFLLY